MRQFFSTIIKQYYTSVRIDKAMNFLHDRFWHFKSMSYAYATDNARVRVTD